MRERERESERAILEAQNPQSLQACRGLHAILCELVLGNGHLSDTRLAHALGSNLPLQLVLLLSYSYTLGSKVGLMYTWRSRELKGTYTIVWVLVWNRRLSGVRLQRWLLDLPQGPLGYPGYHYGMNSLESHGTSWDFLKDQMNPTIGAI